MAIFWLKVALACYAAGLLYALALLTRRGAALQRIILPIVSLGMIFQFVSLVEAAVLEHQTVASVHYSESLLAFLLMFIFMGIRVRYKTASPGLIAFPVVFLLSCASALGQSPPQLSNPLLHSGWILIHIALILIGYAGLFVSFAASVLYLAQARNLKTRGAGRLAASLPPLETMDDICFKSLLLGFPCMTLGLFAGALVAENKYGAAYFLDPKVMLSLLMWAVYVLLLYTRWNNGWRGRRAAYLGAGAFLAALGAWAANYVSNMHRFVSP